jgi:hypothetical protein
MPKKKKSPLPILHVRKGATQREVYAASRAQFTAADLQKFTEVDQPMIPFDQLLDELDAITKEEAAKLQKRNRKSSK